MDGMLSQEEINALLGSMDEGGGDTATEEAPAAGDTVGGGAEALSADEADTMCVYSYIICKRS